MIAIILLHYDVCLTQFAIVHVFFFFVCFFGFFEGAHLLVREQNYTAVTLFREERQAAIS